MRRLVSNIEVEAADGGELVAGSNFLLAELAVQAGRELHWWAGRATHRLRRVDGAAPHEPQDGRAGERGRAPAEPRVPDLRRA